MADADASADGVDAGDELDSAAGADALGETGAMMGELEAVQAASAQARVTSVPSGRRVLEITTGL